MDWVPASTQERAITQTIKESTDTLGKVIFLSWCGIEEAKSGQLSGLKSYRIQAINCLMCNHGLSS